MLLISGQVYTPKGTQAALKVKSSFIPWRNFAQCHKNNRPCDLVLLPSDRKRLGDGGAIEARFLPDSFQAVSYCIFNIRIMESEHNKFNKAREKKRQVSCELSG